MNVSNLVANEHRLNVAEPLTFAVQEYQTPNAVVKPSASTKGVVWEAVGSLPSRVAPTVVPETEPAAPVSATALEKLSFAGALALLSELVAG